MKRRLFVRREKKKRINKKDIKNNLLFVFVFFFHSVAIKSGELLHLMNRL